MIHLVEIEGLNPAGTLVTHYFCTLDTVARGGFISAPTDTPPNKIYEPRVINPGTYERHLWRPGQTQGAGFVTVGVVEIANADGVLDSWIDWDWDGRAVRILRGDADAPRASFEVMLIGTAQSLSLSWTMVQINLRDRMAEVSAMPIVTDRYGGTNVLPNGVDGTKDDVKDKYRPWVLGEVEGISPPRVNSSKLIYEISRYPIAALVGVQEGGNAITAGTVRANIAALEAGVPASGHYDWCLGTGTEGAYFRLGSSPLLPITCMVQEGANAAARTIAQIVKRILLRLGIDASDLTRLDEFDALQAGVVGWYVDINGADAGVVINALCASGGTSWTVRRDGTFELLRLQQPAASTRVAIYDQSTYDSGKVYGPVGDNTTLIVTHILDSSTPLAIIPTDNNTGGVPNYEIDLSWQHNWTVMTGADVAGVVTDARTDWLGLAYRSTKVTAPGIWNPTTKVGRNPLSKPLEIVTQFRVEADAIAEANRLVTLYGVRRRYFSLTVSAPVVGGVDLGAIITLIMPRFGCEAGSDFMLTGMLEDRAANITELFLWQ